MPSIEHFFRLSPFPAALLSGQRQPFTDPRVVSIPTLLVAAVIRGWTLMLTGCEPGELFIVRNVANLVPPCQEGQPLSRVSAALEYAVISALQVERIIVLGHASCGGIRALMEGITDHQRTAAFTGLSIVRPGARVCAHHASADNDPVRGVAEPILVSLDNLPRTGREPAKLQQLLGW